MKWILKFSSIIILTLLLQGCPSRNTTYFYNHSGGTIKLVLAESEVNWETNESIKIEYRNNEIGWNDLKTNIDANGKFNFILEFISTDGYRMRYKISSAGYSLNQNANKIKCNFQVAVDGSLYAVPINLTLPVDIEKFYENIYKIKGVKSKGSE